MKQLLFMVLVVLSTTHSIQSSSYNGSYAYRRTDTRRPEYGEYDYSRTDTRRPQRDRMRYTREHEKAAYEARLKGSDLAEKQKGAVELRQRNKVIAKAIADKFDMNDPEAFTTETFKELAEQAAKDRKPLFIAVVEAPGNNYHIFHAGELANAFANRQFNDPINRQKIREVRIYQYDKNNSSTFPFKYIETIPYMDNEAHPVSRNLFIQHYSGYSGLRAQL